MCIGRMHWLARTIARLGSKWSEVMHAHAWHLWVVASDREILLPNTLPRMRSTELLCVTAVSSRAIASAEANRVGCEKGRCSKREREREHGRERERDTYKRNGMVAFDGDASCFVTGIGHHTIKYFRSAAQSVMIQTVSSLILALKY